MCERRRPCRCALSRVLARAGEFRDLALSSSCLAYREGAVDFPPRPPARAPHVLARETISFRGYAPWKGRARTILPRPDAQPIRVSRFPT